MKLDLLKKIIISIIFSCVLINNAAAGLISGSYQQTFDDSYLGGGLSRDAIFDINSFLDPNLDFELTSASIFFRILDDDSNTTAITLSAGNAYTYDSTDCFFVCDEIYYSDVEGLKLESNTDIERANVTVGNESIVRDGYFDNRSSRRNEFSHRVEIPVTTCGPNSSGCFFKPYKRYYNRYLTTKANNGISSFTYNLNPSQLLDLASDGKINTTVTATASDFDYRYATISFEGIESERPNYNEVPEPSTLAIFALGIIGLASRRFKKQS
jgi:hypothetical protein